MSSTFHYASVILCLLGHSRDTSCWQAKSFVMNRILSSVVALSFAFHLGVVEAQLFKGRAQRQSGGNSMQNQPQQRGGLFQKGRERREANQNIGGQSFNNNSYQPQPKTGLFKRGNERKESGGGLFNKNRQQYATGASVRKGGLFAKARERKLEEYNKANSYQIQSRSYSSSNSQSSNSYVRSNQKVTGASGLFNQPTNPSAATNPSRTSQSTFNTLGASQQPDLSVVASRPETQPDRSELPSLVSATAEAVRQKERLGTLTVAPTALKTPPTTGPKVPSVTVDASLLKAKAPPAPDARPTSNQPDLSKPKAEVTAAVLA